MARISLLLCIRTTSKREWESATLPAELALFSFGSGSVSTSVRSDGTLVAEAKSRGVQEQEGQTTRKKSVGENGVTWVNKMSINYGNIMRITGAPAYAMPTCGGGILHRERFLANPYARLVSGIVVVSLFAGASGAQAVPGREARVRQEFTQEVAQGTQALQAGNNQEAEKAYRQALALDPHSVEVLNNLAISIARQGREPEAIELYEKALSLRKNDPVTERNLGVAYFRAQRYSEALPLLKSFAQGTPTFQSLDLAGLDLFALDRYHEAATYLERASQADPKDLPTLDILGKAYWREKNYSGVTAVFERIMAVDPNSPEAHFMLGLADDIEYKEQDAVREFQAVLAADPNYPDVHQSLGLIDWRENKANGAEEEFQQELKGHPNDPVSNYMMGLILQKQGSTAQAVPYLHRAVTVNPSYLAALFQLGQCYLAESQPAEAVKPLERAAEIAPDDAQVHFVLGRAYGLAGHSAEAARERNRAQAIQARQNVQPPATR
ncbi:MAG: tetratricopeptide repeat protein [Acidobacteriaceae bacterium]